jgi:8-oxo-dGTP pyrophosphatase MutT (NUDIX family)
MAKEYSIYFNSRKIVLTSKFKFYFKRYNGLFIKYQNPKEIAKLLVFFQSTSNVDNLYIVGSDVKDMFKEFCKHFELIEAAGGVVQNEDSDVLLIKRNGLWDLPKGKSMDGEAPEFAALREVTEECGISKIVVEKPLIKTYHTYQEGNKKILKRTSWFKMIFSGDEQSTPQLIENITEVRWVNVVDLPNYIENTYPSIRDVFKSTELI